MKKKLQYGVWFICSVLWMGCSDSWLDVVPENDIETIETSFEKREDAEKWLKTCYVFMIEASSDVLNEANPAYLGADEFCGNDFARTQGATTLFIGDGLQMAHDPYGNVWHKNQYYAAIRYCNLFLENIGGVYNMDEDEKKLWAAEVKAVKAFYYFDLMRRYGPIVLMEENLDPNTSVENMLRSRRPIDEVVDVIVALCDDAMRDLPYMSMKETTHKLFFNKEATATLKALTLLYAASPLFNGNVMFSEFVNENGEKCFPEYDHEKWHRAALACDSAIMICTAAGKDLVSGSGDYPTPLLNTMKDIERTWLGDSYDSPEGILMLNNIFGEDDMFPLFLVPYVDQQYSEYYDGNSYGCLGVPMKMVEMFYTEHGLPIEEDRQWMVNKYAMTKEYDERYKDVVPMGEDVLSLHRRREPRFYAMVGADRTYWYRASNSSGVVSYKAMQLKNRQGEETGTVAKRYDESQAQNITGYWIKKWISSELSMRDYTNQVGNASPAVRYFFRLAELYLAAAEAWNEYLETPDERVWDPLDKVRERAGILKVRETWQSYAKTPDKVNTQDGMREIIHQEWNIEFMFEGRRYWNVRRWMTAQEELNTPQRGWNVLASDEKGFYNNFEGPIVVWEKQQFAAPRDYFTPIRSEEILISGIKQNLGW